MKKIDYREKDEINERRMAVNSVSSTTACRAHIKTRAKLDMVGLNFSILLANLSHNSGMVELTYQVGIKLSTLCTIL